MRGLIAALMFAGVSALILAITFSFIGHGHERLPSFNNFQPGERELLLDPDAEKILFTPAQPEELDRTSLDQLMFRLADEVRDMEPIDKPQSAWTDEEFLRAARMRVQ